MIGAAVEIDWASVYIVAGNVWMPGPSGIGWTGQRSIVETENLP